VWPDSTGAPKLHPIDSTAGTWNGDTLRISVLWPFGATAGPGTGQQLDVYDDGSVDALPFSVMDLAAPVVVQARLGYAAQGTTQDTLVVRFSEPVQLGGATILRVRSSDGTIRDVVGRNPIQSADGLSALIFLDVTDPSLTVFSRNDAVQAYPGAAGVRDNLGNEALVTGHFEPVVFGHRPARFAFDFLPGKLVDASSAVAPTDGPTIQILVRSAGATTWQALDGSPVDPQVARIGPHILSNGTLGGEITLFDNIGSHVASRSLGDLQTAAAAGTLPVDPSGQWEAWIAWDGRSSQGRSAVSGVYTMRVILRRPSDNGKTWTGWMNKVYRIGWIRKN
jgi:hypothetical protein